MTESTNANDPRLARILKFFEDHRAPILHLAPDFLLAADRYKLDWRLLPCICMVESGCGKRYVKNNMFGWNSARTGFSSLRESIHKIAERLANSRLYRDKGLDDVLSTYNSDPEYPGLVRRFMRIVDGTDPGSARKPTRDAALRNRNQQLSLE